MPIRLEATDASRTVVDRVQSLGGSVTCVYRTPLTLQAHLRPEQFPLPMEEPLPPVRRITQLARIEGRGAAVQYRKPDWKLQERPAAASPAFKFPADRSAGSGAKKVRPRRVRLSKPVLYNLP